MAQNNISSSTEDIRAPSRLGSPFVLREPPRQRSQCCSARRKPVSHSQRRRRNIPRRERATHPFDQLPWIHLLEQEADATSGAPWDLADLPITPDENHGPGPVRSRKSSLRNNPLASSPSSKPCLPISPASPVTPRPAKSRLPSRVLFRNLMPVSPSSPSSIDLQSLEL